MTESSTLPEKDRNFSFQRLTPRQKEAMQHRANGLKGREIAEELGISYSATRALFSRIHKRLGTRNKTEAVIKAFKSREIDL